jgi:Ca2+-binding RTX toxin-like protein
MRKSIKTLLAIAAGRGGKDVLVGGHGHDLMIGGPGKDRFRH